MESALTYFNRIGECPVKEFIDIKDLQIGKEYGIVSFQRMKTKFGNAIVVETDEFKTFLPSRFVTKLDDKMLKEFNKQKLFLIFDGLRDEKYAIIKLKKE